MISALAVISVNVPVAGAESDPSISLTARLHEATHLLEDANRARYEHSQKAMGCLLAAEAIMPPDYSRADEVRVDIVELEERLQGILDMPGLDEQTRLKYRQDALERRRKMLMTLDGARKAHTLVELAQREASYGLLNDADKDFREALRLGWVGPLLARNGQPIEGDWLLTNLVKAGRDKQAEEILIYTEQQYKLHANKGALEGKTNYRIAEQVAKRIDILVDRRRLAEAGVLLSDIFADEFEYAKDELSRYYLFKQLHQTIDKLAKSTPTESRQKALDWAQRLLAWQIKYYDDDDYRIADTRLQLAVLQEQRSNWKEATEFYSKALSSILKYGGDEKKYEQANLGLCSTSAALAVESASENKKMVAAVKEQLTQAKSSFAKIKALAPGFDDSEDTDKLMARFEELKRLCPYGAVAGSYYPHLVRSLEKQQVWSSIPPVVAASINYQRHTSPDLTVSGCEPVQPMASVNRDMLLVGMQALLKAATPEAAIEFLQSQIQIAGRDAVFDDYANFAQAASLIGKRGLALTLWTDAINRANSISDTFALERVGIPSLEAIKATEEAARATKIVAKIRAESQKKQDDIRLLYENKRRSGFVPPPLSTNPYAFNYAALASDSLTVGPDARLLLYDGPGSPWWYSFAGSFGTFKITESPMQSGQFKFIYHGAPDTFGPPAHLIEAANFEPALVGTRFFYGPPAVPKLPFAPPPKAPSSAQHINWLSKFTTFKPGDYVASGAGLYCIDVMQQGEVRWYLSDSADAKTALTIPETGRINCTRGDRHPDQNGDFVLPYQFYIFYGGKKLIHLEKGAVFNGSIYAPLADVVLEDGAQIRGAVIARNITLNGSSAIYFVRH